MTDWIRYTLIVPAAYRDIAWNLANGIATPGSAEGMFTVGLSASGAAPATHFISSGQIWPEFAALLGDAQATYDAAGGQVPLAQIQALYANSVIHGPTREVVQDGQTVTVETDPHAVIAELGLKFVQEAV